MAIVSRLVRGQSHCKAARITIRDGWVRKVMEQEAEIARTS
jgi:hypothetical protein